jgi:hypothetical protein
MTKRTISIKLTAKVQGDDGTPASENAVRAWSEQVADKMITYPGADQDVHIYSDKPSRGKRTFTFQVGVEIPEAIDEQAEAAKRNEAAAAMQTRLVEVLKSLTGADVSASRVATASGTYSVAMTVTAKVPGYDSPNNFEPLTKWADPIADELAKIKGVGSDIKIESWHSSTGHRRFTFTATAKVAAKSSVTAAQRAASNKAIEDAKREITKLALSVQGTPCKADSVSVAAA